MKFDNLDEANEYIKKLEDELENGEQITVAHVTTWDEAGTTAIDFENYVPTELRELLNAKGLETKDNKTWVGKIDPDELNKLVSDWYNS